MAAKVAKSNVQSDTAPTRRQHRYNVEDIDRALCATAYFNGNTRRAASALKGQGLSIPRSTIRGWLTTHADRYETLRADLLPRIHERVAEKHLELADAQMDASWEFLDRLLKEKDNIPPRDLSTVQRNLDTGSGIHTDKAAMLRGKGPAPVRVNISIESSIRELDASGGKFYDEAGEPLTVEEAIKRATATPSIEGSATEVEPETD
jgi:hypothetical protein